MVRLRHGLRAAAFCAALVTIFFATPVVEQARAGVPPASGRATATDGWIVAEADLLSGRLLTVSCVANAADWASAVESAGLAPARHGTEYYGLSIIAAGAMYLSPYVCEGLRLGRKATTRDADALQVAWSVNVLIHESMHMGLHTFDEALAEACARVGLPIELHRLFGISYRSPELRRLTLAAALLRDTMDAEYKNGTCTAPDAG